MKSKNRMLSPVQKIFSEVLAHLKNAETGEDNAGRTQLEVLADGVGALNDGSKEAAAFLEAGAELLRAIQTLNESQVEALSAFLIQCDRWSVAMKDVIVRLLGRIGNTSAIARKRGDLLRMASRAGIQFQEREIERETEVRNARPWLWFDFAVSSIPGKAAEYAKKLKDEPGFLDPCGFECPL